MEGETLEFQHWKLGARNHVHYIWYHGIIWLVAVSYVAVCLYMSLPTSGLVASCLCTFTVPEFTQQVFDAKCARDSSS